MLLKFSSEELALVQRLEQVAKLKRMHVISMSRQIRGERYAW